MHQSMDSDGEEMVRVEQRRSPHVCFHTLTRALCSNSGNHYDLGQHFERRHTCIVSTRARRFDSRRPGECFTPQRRLAAQSTCLILTGRIPIQRIIISTPVTRSHQIHWDTVDSLRPHHRFTNISFSPIPTHPTTQPRRITSATHTADRPRSPTSPTVIILFNLRLPTFPLKEDPQAPPIRYRLSRDHTPTISHLPHLTTPSID